MKLQGIFPALTTPFAADGSLALGQLRDNLSRYNRVPLAGYLSVGSTGESVLLTLEEVERVWAATREAAAPGKILIAGTGVDSTAQTIARTRRAAELGFDAALVKTPYYFKPQMTAGALEEHFRRVADASPIPILLYSVPQFTGITVTADQVARLAEHPNIVGIKESSGNVALAAEIVHTTPPAFQTLVGSGSALLAGLHVGAVGGVLALACFLPEASAEIWEAFGAKDYARADRLQRSVLAASRKIVSEMGIPGVKYAMDCAGYFGGAARAPFLPLTAAQRGIVEGLLAELRPRAVAAQRFHEAQP
jgi:4-hydroxy-2-oxoglutarate aldolase